jgi:hypothetical protein
VHSFDACVDASVFFSDYTEMLLIDSNNLQNRMCRRGTSIN